MLTLSCGLWGDARPRRRACSASWSRRRWSPRRRRSRRCARAALTADQRAAARPIVPDGYSFGHQVSVATDDDPQGPRRGVRRAGAAAPAPSASPTRRPTAPSSCSPTAGSTAPSAPARSTPPSPTSGPTSGDRARGRHGGPVALASGSLTGRGVGMRRTVLATVLALAVSGVVAAPAPGAGQVGAPRRRRPGRCVPRRRPPSRPPRCRGSPGPASPGSTATPPPSRSAVELLPRDRLRGASWPRARSARGHHRRRGARERDATPLLLVAS